MQALGDLCAMWGLLVGCVCTFADVSLTAAGLLIPYLLWLVYAGTLNYSIVLLNGPALSQPGHNITHLTNITDQLLP